MKKIILLIALMSCLGCQKTEIPSGYVDCKTYINYNHFYTNVVDSCIYTGLEPDIDRLSIIYKDSMFVKFPDTDTSKTLVVVIKHLD